MVAERVILRERFREYLERLDPLAEDDGFPAVRSDFFHVREQLFHLSAFACERVEVANLF
jgi:hypothetical protein